jgi:hypothetical protein
MKQTIKLHEMMWDNGTGRERQEVEVEIEATKDGILIKPKGYGDHCTDDGYGCPVLVELCNGHPRVVVWSDINQEDPTNIISLDGAAESLRKPD